MKLSLIAAMAKNRVLGKDNKMPWHLPGELAYFKKVTLGKPVLMGRNTFDSIGKPLPGRRNMVISSQPGYAPDGVEVFSKLQVAMAAVSDVEELMVVGGGKIYEAFVPYADRLYLTQIDAEFEGDTFFPALNPLEWKEISAEKHSKDEKNAYDFTCRVLERI